MRKTLLLRVLDFQRGEDATRSWAAGVAAEFAARLGDANAAERWYREAFELDPQSHYARITYADWLLSAGRFDEALQVASRGASLADRARSVLAGRDARALDAQRLQLAWQEADARGERAHLRDRARFELMLLHDPAKANASARASFQDRNEADDALLLAATAAATRDQESLRAVRAWQQRHRYEDVRLDNLLGARAMRKLLAVIVLLFACVGAFAHTSGSSFLALRAQGASTVHAEWDFDIRDLHQSLQLDEDGDGALTWAEIVGGATRDRIPRARAHTPQRGRRRMYGEVALRFRRSPSTATDRICDSSRRSRARPGRSRSIIPDGSRSTRAIAHCSSTKRSTACGRRRSWAAA